MQTFLHAQRFKIFSVTCLLCSFGFLGVALAVPTTVTFDTDFMTNVGAGTIVDQGNPELARIFTYEAQGVFASAIPFTNPDPTEAPSHDHLFDETILPGIDNVGLLMGDDAAGVSFSVGGMTPTTPFDVLNLKVVQVGPPNVFLRSFRNGAQIGEITLMEGFSGSPTFDSAQWSGMTRFTATFGVPGEEAPEGGRLVLDNVQVNPVPEPSTIGLFGTWLAGLCLGFSSLTL